MVTRGHHRGGMFRGGRSGGFRGGRNSARNSVFIPFQPFDIEHCEHHFPRMETAESSEDSKLGEMLLQRNKMLVPNPDTISIFDAMLTQVKEGLMKLEDENTEGENKCIFEEIRKIGAFSNETLIEGCKEAEILLQLKEAPKLDKIGSLAKEIASIMGADYKVETDEENSTITVSNSKNLRLCCFVTCIGVKIKGVTEEHIVKKVLYKNFDMGKRSRWFDEYGQEPNVKVLARIIADLRVRFQGFKGMTQWALELLAHYCVTKYDEQGNITALSIAAAFKRCLMILSSGFFLPGSAGIRDPIERDGRSVHQNFSKTDQDQICATAQTLLRVLMQGAPQKVIGLESGNICEEMQIIDGIVIQPSLSCHVEDEAEPENKME